ncbi:type IV secretion system DNA-binding domain-containing protein [Candidatus Villigracilis saccharophilus]|uniref:type IV secretory system conjugative DNA transfer family protein n=1 Tax=Candidatus Villigracilis saccharophilus TaxID=3140684 RepID=UPI003136CAC4|nr:type IV secretion system DNA-binding domain-containing protein [Anaerolineales bacterium]
MICIRCGYEFASSPTECSLCSGGPWQAWELLFAPHALDDLRAQVAGWLGQLPFPTMIEWIGSPKGLRIRLFLPPQLADAEAVTRAWAAMTGQHSRWRKLGMLDIKGTVYAFHPSDRLPSIIVSAKDSDTLLAIGSRLINAEAGLRLWLLGNEGELQERLRSLSAYSYGTEGGVQNNAPNPWGFQLELLRGMLFLGMIMAGISAGIWNAGWFKPVPEILFVLAGTLISIAASWGIRNWLEWRSIPKEVLEKRIQEPLIRVALSLSAPIDLPMFAGQGSWRKLADSWPEITGHTFPQPASDLAGLIAPLQLGEGSGLLDRDTTQEVPAPPPSQPLLEAVFKIGQSVATDEMVGIDPDVHGMATGGSRSGKTSFVFALLEQLIAQGHDAPGIFLTDPHVSLADAFLDAIAQLPEEQRLAAIKRLRIITPDQPYVIPLNLLAVPDFTWAGNAIVQIGRRIWDDYWGPRMQAALLGLFRIAHVWNQDHPDDGLGLLHVVFMAYNKHWRHTAIAALPPAERMSAIALDALLGQTGEEDKKSQSWITEVISPVLSKVMALELSPWLFSAMHQERFVDLKRWINERDWIILRLPSGEMGREGARLTASVVYNVFDAAYRRATLEEPIPFYIIVDEAQEIGSGMRLESMLSEGAKFGARMFVLAQSMSMMRKVEGMEPVVQAMLANTSTQMFFSPDPEDADLIRATLNSTVRYGEMTLDLPSLECWLRARVNGHWQPPTLIRIKPLPRADRARVNRLIEEVIAEHQADYQPIDGWQERASRVLRNMLPKALADLLEEFLGARMERQSTRVSQPEPPADPLNLGL